VGTFEFAIALRCAVKQIEVQKKVNESASREADSFVVTKL
jgi:hypothetical protein